LSLLLLTENVLTIATDAFSPVRVISFLYLQGRISDAVVRVLEDKDIAVTVSLLEQLTPAQVTASCSHLERLCITQQLAADMSVNIPIEVRTALAPSYSRCVARPHMCVLYCIACTTVRRASASAWTG
jgi:hypothetical protein